MRYLKFLTIVAFLAGFTFLVGCGDDDGNETTPLEDQLAKISKTWSISSASLDGDDRTSDWSGFTVTFTENQSYSTQNSADDNVWPSGGTFTFEDETTPAGLNTLNRSDGIVLSLSNLTPDDVPTNVTISFDFLLSGANQSSRVESIEGSWVFTMTAN